MGSWGIRAKLAGAAWLCATFIASAAMAQHELPRVQFKPPALEPAPAAPPAPTAVAPLIVQATKPAELKRQTHDFVQTFAATSDMLDQVARWTQPVCVTLQGLSPDAAAEVKGRVEEVAKALKVGVRKAGCTPNIQIAFTGEPKALIDKVAREDELMLGFRHHSDREKLTTITHPVQAWYATGTGGADVDTVGIVFSASGGSGQVPAGFKRPPNGFQYDDEDNYQGRAGCGDSRFSSCLSSEFQHVLVIVDTNRVQDYPAGLIADYVVMLTMAQPKSLDGCNVLPSVIDLFSKDCANFGMDGLTRADVAYLTALYRTNLESKKAGQQTDIASRMADMLLKARTADRRAIWGEMQKTSAGR
jgi:hypothetical protein